LAGDVFVFGLFLHTISRDGQLRWAPGTPMLHVLFGYLKIGEVRHIRSPQDMAGMPWTASHPHARVWSPKLVRTGRLVSSRSGVFASIDSTLLGR
jgi:Nucleotide modification associated domain 3